MARDPQTLQKLNLPHLKAAAAAWQAGERVAALKSTTPWEAQIDGHWYPTKAILALAHRHAGLGELTRETLAGEAARRRLRELEIPLRKAGAAAPEPEANNPIQVLQRRHIEAGAAAMRVEFAITQKNIAYKPHETEWRIGIGDLWYSPRALRAYAFEAANERPAAHSRMTAVEYQRFLQHIESLGFPVKRGRTPVRARTAPWRPGDLRQAAAALIGLPAEAPPSNTAEEEADPLQVVLDGTAYPAAALLGLEAGTAPDHRELAAIREAGAMLRAAPDPLDCELSELATSTDLSTEARRAIIARIGQGSFRKALLKLHGGCSVTGVSTTAVLRAAHIHRWADCADTPAARLDPDNGLLLTANLDALFEVGLIAFSDEGDILISPQLDADAQQALGVHTGLRLALRPSAAQIVYLSRHRDRTRAMCTEAPA